MNKNERIKCTNEIAVRQVGGRKDRVQLDKRMCGVGLVIQDLGATGLH